MKTKVAIRGFMVMVLTFCIASAVQAADFSGTTSGIFDSAVGPVTMVTTGQGANYLTWGDPDGFGTGPSALTFTGMAFSGIYETEFKFSAIDYFNGTIVSGTGADAVDLLATLTFIDPSGVIQDFNVTFQLINTPNTGAPMDQADTVLLSNAYDPTAFFTVGGID